MSKKIYRVKSNYLPWVESYRPRYLNGIIGQNNIVSMLEYSIKNNELPNLLLYGPAGTGKTSAIHALCRHFFEEDKRNILELNASDDRGIKVVRELIKKFAKNSVIGNYKFKLIILDEADSMTNDSQCALRKIIETYSDNNKFILMCNYINKIIKPIQSRCAKFHFNKIEVSYLRKIAAKINQIEKINLTKENIELITYLSDGDLRVMIGIMQKIKLFKSKKEISNEEIRNLSSFIPDGLIQKIFKVTLNKKTKYSHLAIFSKNIIKKSYILSDILLKLLKIIFSSDKFDDQQKCKISIKFAEINNNLNTNSNSYLQLLAALSFIKNIYH